MALLETRTMAIPDHRLLLVLAWSGTLFASLLPTVIGEQFLGQTAQEVIWMQSGVVAVLLAAAIFYPPARRLRGYLFMLMAILFANGLLIPWIGSTRAWQGLFPPGEGSWFSANFGDQTLRLLPTLGVWLLLTIMGFRRRDYFLATGDINAPTAPVQWLAIKPVDRWIKTGLTFLFMIALITLIAMSQSFIANARFLPAVLGLFPAIALFAALNAFNENFTYRSGLLPVLLPVFGKQQALILAAAFFGLGHLNFVQLSPFNVLLSGFLGWVLGKSMVETRDFTWARLIQFPLDILSFAAIAAGMLAMG